MKLPPHIMDAIPENHMPQPAQQALAKIFGRVTKAVNSISFGSPTGGSGNIDGKWVTIVSPGVADTEFTFSHNLGRVPSGYKVMRQNKAAVTYDGATLWTDTQMSLKCNTATVSLTIFVF